MTGGPIRWGILGASGFALRDMAPAIHGARGTVMAALATRTPAKAAPFQALAPGLTVHADYDALLADPGVDAVYVPLPNALHAPWGLRALAAGKAVLIEKPVALAAAEVDALIAARDASGLVAAEAFMIVHHPQWAFVRTLLGDGAIGPLRQVDGHFTYDNRDPANIRNRAETGGGALLDVGVYPVGATRWATGTEPEVVHAQVEREAGCDVVARVSARADGFNAQWLVSMRMARSQAMRFHGEAGEIALAAPFNPGRAGAAVVRWTGADGVMQQRAWTGLDQYAAQVEAFGAAMRGGPPFPWTLEDAAGTLAVLDAVRAAAG